MLFTSNSNNKNSNLELKYIDLFCGIGGFRIALELACSQYKFKIDTPVDSVDGSVNLRYNVETVNYLSIKSGLSKTFSSSVFRLYNLFRTWLRVSNKVVWVKIWSKRS